MTIPPKISVIMTAYNSASYIKEAIESITNQTYKDFELVIVNDGSTDSTLDIIRKCMLKDSRIKVIDKPNTGIVDSANIGLSKASGVYVARMDSDDVSHPRRFSEQIKFLEDNPSISAVSTAVRHIGDNEHFSFPSSDSLELGFIPELVNPALMFKRKDIDKHKIIYQNDHLYAEDCGFLYSLTMSNLKLGNLTKPLLLYRVHNKSVTRKYNEIQKESTRKIISGRYDFIDTEQLVDIYLKRISYDDVNEGLADDFIFLYSKLNIIHPKRYLDEYFAGVAIKIIRYYFTNIKVPKRLGVLFGCVFIGVIMKIKKRIRSKHLSLKYRDYWRSYLDGR